MNALRSIGDRLLGAFLPSLTADACIPEVNQICYCYNHRVYRYNCQGTCYNTNNYC